MAEQHSIAVDFAKSGEPATIPTIAKWTGPRAHWREKKDERTYHCDSVIGKLYDMVATQSGFACFKNFKLGLAGRELNERGQVFSIHGQVQGQGDPKSDREAIDDIYNPSIPIILGWLAHENELETELSSFASEQRFSYDTQVMKVMRKYGIQNEGEFSTGCIRKFEKANKNRQHDVAEEVRRQGREIDREHRATFFRFVLKIANAATFRRGAETQRGNPSSSSGLESMRSIEVAVLELEQSANVRGPSGFIQLDSDALNRTEAEFTDDDLDWVERVTTSESHIEFDVFSREWMVLTIARKLAAAYYMVTYAPWRETAHGILLFGFPWIVSDVFACALTAQHRSDTGQQLR